MQAIRAIETIGSTNLANAQGLTQPAATRSGTPVPTFDETGGALWLGSCYAFHPDSPQLNCKYRAQLVPAQCSVE